MKNVNKILLAGAITLGLTAVANTEASADSYTVRQGDTIWGLAQANGVTIDEIDALNPTINQDTHLIIVGDTITLPSATVTLPETPAVNQTAEPAVSEQPQVDEPLTVQPTPQVVAPVQTTTVQAQPVVSERASVAPQGYGSVHDQFISAGGTEAMWSAIVLPESGGDVNASNGQYHGLGQTNQSWGYGSVAEQTQGMLQYAQERYNGIDGAISFRESHNFW